MAAGEAHLEPSQCAVFEDSPTGVRSGVAAKCHVIGIGTSAEPQTLLNEGALTHINDYLSLDDVHSIEELIESSR